MDRLAIKDRLYAERLAAPLRDRTRFFEAKFTTNEAGIDTYVRARGEDFRKDLSVTAADIEWAIEDVERTWNQGDLTKSSPRIVSLLSYHARRLLRPSGRHMVLQVNQDEPGREILRWRFVSLALPPGILMAAATRDGTMSPEAVRILDRSIAPDFPVAQHHVHHAAMMSFEELWASLRLRALLRPGDLVTSLCEERAFCPRLHPGLCLGGRSETDRGSAKKHLAERAKHMAEWGDLIRQAFIAGRVLDHHSHHRGSLEKCTDDNCAAVARTTLRYFRAGRTKPYSEMGTPYPWLDELIRLARRSRKANAAAVLRQSHVRRTSLMRRLTAEESRFLSRAFDYLCPMSDVSHDPLYEILFIQYLRVKTAVFGLLVHPPGEHGLANFLDHFLQIKVYAPESELLRPRRPNEPGLNVQATEYRVAPDAWFKILRRQDAEVEEGVMSESPPPEAAWLIHFKRKSHDRRLLPLYGSAIRTMESEADQIVRSLSAEPRHLRTLRGIDICGVEEAQPLWVSAETLRRLRACSYDVAGSRPDLNLLPLRLTLHAGEDFRWLTSGVRAIAEPFHWHLIERGDRIGHGIAITLEPEEWWRRKEGQVFPVKRFDRLLDLAFLAEYAREPSAEEEEWLREEIRQTVVTLKLESEHRLKATPELDLVKTAKEVWRCLGGRLTRSLMEMPHCNCDADREHVRWIHSLLWRRSTQDLGEERIQKRVDDDKNRALTKSARNERDLLVKARKRLIHEVARWQICIESNPSSNLVVGSLDAMAAQDFLAQRPTERAPLGKETLTWTISTDDPITFSTTLADEYAYAWAGMVLRESHPYDPSYARALLDEAAATSMRMRFTVPNHNRAPRNKG